MLACNKQADGWQARLSLGFERREDATVLARREHVGPLRVQKPFHPEGPAVCHALVLHPPAGIAGGDELEIAVRVGDEAHALLTTPGAGKWYRSAGSWASQTIRLEVGAAGVLEWLPQETIVFDGAMARMQMRVSLAANACFIGWEVLCLGRRASGECFDSGAIHMHTRIEREGRPIWLERGTLEGGAPLLHSSAGLAGYSICATLLATAGPDASVTRACRELIPEEAGALHGLTQLPDILVARYLGHSSEAARNWMTALWHLLRPVMPGRVAIDPRIWRT
ncbi:MAG: urease accessory protein UreD [Burkholderiales bacterium]|nr:urease accessory protein UreD [Burkholderiales bacterium]